MGMKPRIFTMSFGSVYPLYVQKATKKGRTKQEVDEVITWLTGYTGAQLQKNIDANVGRFVEMLQGMLDRTQFILITHNRRTMEIANRLYGVTMEEPGVSKLISVQLS